MLETLGTSRAHIITIKLRVLVTICFWGIWQTCCEKHESIKTGCPFIIIKTRLWNVSIEIPILTTGVILLSYGRAWNLCELYFLKHWLCTSVFLFSVVWCYLYFFRAGKPSMLFQYYHSSFVWCTGQSTYFCGKPIVYCKNISLTSLNSCLNNGDLGHPPILEICMELREGS